jgi:hypothetical protein
MSDTYPQKRIEEFEQLSVFRRINNAEQLVDGVRGLADHILGKEITGQVPIEGKEEYLDVGYPYCNVYGASDLRLELFSRRDTPENKPESRFRNVKSNLRRGYSVSGKKKSIIKDPRAPLLEVLDSVQYLDYELVDDELDLDIVGIDISYKADVKNGFYDLSFIPDVASLVGRMLVDQARYTQRRVQFESRKVGYPSNRDSITIPFASMRILPIELIEKERDFHKELRKFLPKTVTVGKPEIK